LRSKVSKSGKCTGVIEAHVGHRRPGGALQRGVDRGLRRFAHLALFVEQLDDVVQRPA
jgi:hypothetical protein